MKELDVLLERFVRDRYEEAPPELKQAFERLLAMPDPLLIDLLLLSGGREAGRTAAGEDASVDAENGRAAAAALGAEDASIVDASIAGASIVDASIVDAAIVQVAALVAAPGGR